MTTSSFELAEADLLAAFPAARTGILIGYARVSTRGQILDRQLDMLTAAGCRRIFADKKSGRNAQRPELTACHAFLQTGDTLVVPELARYGRSLKDLVAMVGDLRKREIGFASLHERFDTTTGGRPTVVDGELLKAARDLLKGAASSAAVRPSPSAANAVRRGCPAATWQITIAPATSHPDPAGTANPAPRERPEPPG